MKLKTTIAFGAIWAMAASVFAQAPASTGKLITKDGKEIAWADVTMTGTSVGWKTRNPQTGGDMVVNIPAADMARIDFPEPQALQDALMALSRNSLDEAVKLAQPVVDQFAPFKAVPGTYYPEASMIQLEAMAIKKDPGYEKLRGDIKTINLNSADSARLGAVDATYDYVRGILGPALTTVDKLIAEQTAATGPNDGSVLAKLFLLKADIQFKRGNYKDALEAYLHVPVFYGAQSAYLPNAELGAARALQKMMRLEDASEMFRNIKDRYKDAPQAADAEKELNNITKVLGTASDSDATRIADDPAPAKPMDKPMEKK